MLFNTNIKTIVNKKNKKNLKILMFIFNLGKNKIYNRAHP